MEQVNEIKQRVQGRRDEIIQFMRDICAIPSMNSEIGPVGERIQEEMRKLGWDEARFDKMGNTVGRIGNGPKVIVYDSHIDTVGVGDPSEWEWDPFIGKVEDGILYARGACDEKNSTPGMVYGLAIAPNGSGIRLRAKSKTASYMRAARAMRRTARRALCTAWPWPATWACWTDSPLTISATWKNGATASRPTPSRKSIPAFAPISR